ncbi:MAG: flavodoxin domain-containing protein [Candidatus Palauibacterales bacterium]|nr:flavodoxin domain-containing protein [Candidatus Palauibacterales bacterium]MDP2528934.1 flavodoxin domain-containing protein [Candidatus Palauibacterales bacterium]MDP2585055.1 flavodoxin domain-containing protein [Candidatus Palauibacterales bacterium]
MDPRPILILFGSKHGQTEKVARRLEMALRERGFRVELVPDDGIPDDLRPERYAAVVVGSSVHFGRHRRALVSFVRRHAAELARVPGVFFSVSGAAMTARPEDVEEANGYLADFSVRTGWDPAHAVAVAGAVRYTAYNPLVRWVMKRISASRGLSVDTSRDHEYTDWEQVDGLAGTIAELALPASRASRDRPGRASVSPAPAPPAPASSAPASPARTAPAG